MNMRIRIQRVVQGSIVLPLVLAFSSLTFSQDKSSSVTQIVLLGTGTPAPLPERSGPCTAIIVNGTPYLVDLGPGVVRRGRPAVRPPRRRAEPESGPDRELTFHEPENGLHHASALGSHSRLSGFHFYSLGRRPNRPA